MQIIAAQLTEIPKLYSHFIIPYFPENEVKPLNSILDMYSDGCYRVYKLADEEKVKAAAFVVVPPDADCVLLDYLAVDAEFQSEGFGGYILKKLPMLLGEKTILIETESIESAANEGQIFERRRRETFYERAGAKKTEHVTLIFGAEYSIWTLGAHGIDVLGELRSIYHYMVSGENYDRHVFIPKKA